MCQALIYTLSLGKHKLDFCTWTLKGTYYAKLTFSLLLYVYLRIRSASPPLKRKFRQLSQCFVICRVKKWVCKRAVWISPALLRNKAGDLNIPALAPGISAHTSSATWTRIRHCVALASLVHDSLTATMYNPKAKHSCSVVGCTDPHVSLHRLPTKEHHQLDSTPPPPDSHNQGWTGHRAYRAMPEGPMHIFGLVPPPPVGRRQGRAGHREVR